MESIHFGTILTFSATVAGDGSSGCIFDYDSPLSDTNGIGYVTVTILIDMMAWVRMSSAQYKRLGIPGGYDLQEDGVDWGLGKKSETFEACGIISFKCHCANIGIG